MGNGVSQEDRRAFIAERRLVSVQRFDTLHSPDYDENWGAISPSHATFVTRLITLIRLGPGRPRRGLRHRQVLAGGPRRGPAGHRD